MGNFHISCTGNIHHVSTDTIRSRCFELHNLVITLKNQSSSDIEYLHLTLKNHYSLIADNYQSYMIERLSELLIEIAIKVRVFNDHYTRIYTRDNYKKYLDDFEQKISSQSILIFKEGYRQEKLNTIIEACNKIIHAGEFAPLYLPNPNSNELKNIKIELRGLKENKEWIVELDPIGFWLGVDYIMCYE